VTGKEAFKEIANSAGVKEERSARKNLIAVSAPRDRSDRQTQSNQAFKKGASLQGDLAADVRTETKE
jgi:hypothetical protein